MPWFKVSDDLHSHPKAMAAGSAAMGLWVIAGSWSSANSKGGFVPDYVLTRLAPDAQQLARKLVTVGLWRRVRAGYQFHQWNERNPTAADAKALASARSDSARYGNHQKWHVARNRIAADCDWCNGAPPPGPT